MAQQEENFRANSSTKRLQTIHNNEMKNDILRKEVKISFCVANTSFVLRSVRLSLQFYCIF